MSYLVVAPLVLAKDEAGRLHYAYEGAVLARLLPEQAEHFVAEGLVVEIEDDADDPDAADSTDDPAAGKPLRAATKEVLVDWLMAHGTYDRAELEAQNKDDLWALIEATD